MSIKIMASVFAMQGIASSKKLVLLSLADHANDDGHSIYPSIDRTALRTGLSARTVQRTIQALVKDDLLKEVEMGGGRHHTNEYHLNIRKIAQIAKQYPERGSSYFEANPDTMSPLSQQKGVMVSPLSQQKGVTVSRKGDMVSQKGVMVSPESSLIIKKHKDTDAKNASVKQPNPKNQNHLPFRNSLIAFFVDRTGIPGPPRDFKAANRLWTTPIYRIGELVEFDIANGEKLVDLALQRLRGLTVSDPNSILKTATSIAGELKVNGGARQFREEVY